MINSLSIKPKLSELLAFARAQVSAFWGGIVDFLVLVALVELVGITYIWGIILGGIVGAIVNFTINRKWSFTNGQSHTMQQQVFRFVLVVIGSILLKTVGTYALVNLLAIDYKIAKLTTDAFVAFGFNYTLQRWWVFK